MFDYCYLSVIAEDVDLQSSLIMHLHICTRLRLGARTDQVLVDLDLQAELATIRARRPAHWSNNGSYYSSVYFQLFCPGCNFVTKVLQICYKTMSLGWIQLWIMDLKQFATSYIITQFHKLSYNVCMWSWQTFHWHSQWLDHDGHVGHMAGTPTNWASDWIWGPLFTYSHI